MFELIKRWIVGKPLRNALLSNEKLSIFWGLPILASDAISSVAYASEEMLLVLIPAIGQASFHQLMMIM